MIIAGLVQLRREVDLALDHTVAAGRAEHDLSWDQVADLTGTTKRAALKRWGDAALERRRAGRPERGEAHEGRCGDGPRLTDRPGAVHRCWVRRSCEVRGSC